MKALVFKIPATQESTWCVADIDCNLPVDQYIKVVHIGGIAEEDYIASNFTFVDQPANVSMQTHEYKDGNFVEKIQVLNQ